MEHELKIIMKFHTEDLDHDQDEPIKSSSIRVSIDDHIIGCIQDMKISANCKEPLPQLEFTFPDLETLDYDKAAYTNMYPLSTGGVPPFVKEIGYHIEKLKQASNIKIKVEGIDDGTSNIIMLEEVGTDGYIDSIPHQRRNL
jgi:hypothetical protein